jgi:hypothetical protein
MGNRDKFRLKEILSRRRKLYARYGFLRGTVKILGDIESPAWNEPWDAELGIAYHGENGPVYWPEIQNSKVGR